MPSGRADVGQDVDVSEAPEMSPPVEAIADDEAIRDDEPDVVHGHLHLPPRPQSVFSYKVKLPDGTVRFSDNSRRNRTPMFQLAILTHRIAQRGCRLPR